MSASSSGGGGGGGGGSLSLRISVGGMHCAACSSAVERALLECPGVTSAAVALTTEEARVVAATEATSEAELQKICRDAIESVGFDVHDIAVISTSSTKQTTNAAAHNNRETDDDIADVTLAVRANSDAVAKAVFAAVNVSPGVVRAHIERAPPDDDGDDDAPTSAPHETLDNGRKTPPTHLITIKYHQNTTGVRDLCDLCTSFNLVSAFPHVSTSTLSAKQRENANEWRRLLRTALLFTIPIMVLSKGRMLCPPLGRLLAADIMTNGPQIGEMLLFLITTPMQFGVGWRFYQGAYYALRRGTANMDVLVALGTSSAYVYSLISILHHMNAHHTSYEHTDAFETSAMLLTFIILGKYLEARAKGKTSEAIATLLRLKPQSAVLLKMSKLQSGDAECTEQAYAKASVRLIDSALVQRNDILRVSPSSLVPCDGIVLSGEAYVDESMLTGESAPKRRKRGDAVVGGTAVTASSSSLIVQATRVGADTALSRIVSLVEQAQLAKAPIQRFADSISARFVPAVVVTAIITFLVWWAAGAAGSYPSSWLPEGTSSFLFALLFGTAVMVVACPCALGLATPTAVMVGTGVGASRGILVKGGDALERASKVTHVCFDKTGTLTTGRPSVVAWCTPTGSGGSVVECSLDRWDGGDSLRAAAQTAREVHALLMACTAEVESYHPLANALLQFCYGKLAGGSSKLEVVSEDAPHFEVEVVSEDAPLLELAPAPAPIAASETLPDDGATNNLEEDARSCDWIPRAAALEVRPGLGVVASGVQVSITPPPTSGVRVGLSAWRQAIGQGAPREGSRVVCGNVALATSEARGGRAALGNGMSRWLAAQEKRARSVAILMRDGETLAAFAVADPLRPEAVDVVSHLLASGISCSMLSGDNEATARAVAASAGISDVHAPLLPEEKAIRIGQLQQRDGCVVAMVGDGINDAPALAAADVGMAIGAGADVAVEAADVVLMRAGLTSVADALALARAVFQRIRLNYVFAMGYNLCAVPVAAGVLYPWLKVRLPPWLAGGAMALSSVSVVVSSLMLRRYQGPNLRLHIQ
ncbi:P-type Cu+ transporter [Pycnococcus provasolii]